MGARKRRVEIVVISDTHLGTYGCHAKELLKYLKSIKPKQLILNGDIIDMWQFSKSYWPPSHSLVLKQIMGMQAKGVKVCYVTGNHDENLRKFEGLKLGTFEIVNKVVLKLNNQKAWVFHGDIFDVTMKHSKWLAKLGATGYDLLILLNRAVNFVSEKFGKGKISLSRRIKNGVKSAIKFIDNFEETVAEIASSNQYDYVICGHIHKPEMKEMTTKNGKVVYLNSGDWVENLTALEYDKGNWSMYEYHQDTLAPKIKIKDKEIEEISTVKLFESLVNEFKIK